jgi:hypothetical protein
MTLVEIGEIIAGKLLGGNGGLVELRRASV